MSNEVKCPHCGEGFDVTEEIERHIERELRAKLTKSIRSEYETKIESRIAESNQEKVDDIERLEGSLKKLRLERNDLKDFQQKFESLKIDSEQNIKDAVAKTEREAKRKFNREMEDRINERIKEDGADKDVKIKELEIKIERQNKKVKEMQDAAERSHGELQGEALEQASFDNLKSWYPLDKLVEVAKGIHGADIEQAVKTPHGTPAGKILYECKYTKHWKDEWLAKIRKDSMEYGANLMIIVTNIMPEGMATFGEKDGVFICRFHELYVVSKLLRFTILEKKDLITREEHLETIQGRVLTYISSGNFKSVMNGIMKAYEEFEDDLRKEENYMKERWTYRRKRLSTVADSISNMIGTLDSIGISEEMKFIDSKKPDLLEFGNNEG